MKAVIVGGVAGAIQAGAAPNPLAERGIVAVFHYIPLHSAPAGLKFGRFHGEDRFTTSESDRLVRLPLYYGLTKEDQETVIRTAMEYFESHE